MAPRLIREGECLVVPAARFEAERSAETILREAEARAAELLRVAEARAAELLEEAHAEADRGRAELAAESARAREAAVLASEGDILQLALELARRLTHRALAQDPEAYGAMAAALIAEARLTSPGVLLAPVGARVDLDGFETLEDASLSFGDLTVETSDARLEAHLDDRLAALARALEPPKTS